MAIVAVIAFFVGVGLLAIGLVALRSGPARSRVDGGSDGWIDSGGDTSGDCSGGDGGGCGGGD